MATVSQGPSVRIQLRKSVVCPHCWNNFTPEETLWAAEHSEFQKDPRLGEAGLRFLPTRFDVTGNAIDPGGTICREVACPECHLRVPRPLFEMPPLMLSIAGTPSCGKTYFLASMTWRLRHCLPKHFALAFNDADPISNLELNEYENQQFFNDKPNEIVKLAKTQEQGDLYDIVQFGDQQVRYPKPFMFGIRPTDNHPNAQKSNRISRLLCLYDNAGESFEAGKDDAASPVTRHLAKSKAILFCFDPTQDPRFRNACSEKTEDPQVVAEVKTQRQEGVFHVIVDQVRKHAGLHQDEKHSRPLIVVVTKYDVWWPLLGQQRLPDPWKQPPGKKLAALDLPLIESTSDRVRELLWEFTPEMVSAAEAFTDRVIYVPVSATGCAPLFDDKTGELLGMRPIDINPMWSEVPLLVTLAKWDGGIIPTRKGSVQASPSGQPAGGAAAGGSAP